jgi:hypothetical protein
MFNLSSKHLLCVIYHSKIRQDGLCLTHENKFITIIVCVKRRIQYYVNESNNMQIQH